MNVESRRSNVLGESCFPTIHVSNIHRKYVFLACVLLPVAHANISGNMEADQTAKGVIGFVLEEKPRASHL